MAAFDLTNHKRLWNWLADNPDKGKSDWPEWEDNTGTIKSQYNDCFACQFGRRGNNNGDCIGYCPLVWPDNHIDDCDDCMGTSGLFYKWDECAVGPQRSELAREIANLPVRDGVLTK